MKKQTAPSPNKEHLARLHDKKYQTATQIALSVALSMRPST